MKTSVSIITYYPCSLERAFRTPILCDVSKIHTGFGVMPKVTHCTEDNDWGKPGSTKKVFVDKSISFKGGEASQDKVIERRENAYWKIEVSNFKSPMLGFTKFVGEWETTELATNKIKVNYTYTMHSDYLLLYPLNWLFTKVFWKIYMQRVCENIRKLIDSEEPYQYA